MFIKSFRRNFRNNNDKRNWFYEKTLRSASIEFIPKGVFFEIRYDEIYLTCELCKGIKNWISLDLPEGIRWTFSDHNLKRAWLKVGGATTNWGRRKKISS